MFYQIAPICENMHKNKNRAYVIKGAEMTLQVCSFTQQTAPGIFWTSYIIQAIYSIFVPWYIYPFIHIIKPNFVDFYVHRQLRADCASSLARGPGLEAATQCSLFQLSQATENFWSSASHHSPGRSLLACFHQGALSPPSVRKAGRKAARQATLHCRKSEYRKMALRYLHSANRFSVLD